MKTFLAGLVVGSVVCALGFLLLDAGEDRHEMDSNTVPETSTPESPNARLQTPQPQLEGTQPAPESVASSIQDKAFPPGEITLRVGEGYVFEKDHASTRAASDTCDIYCQDIRYGASLACRHGAGPALAPMTAVGLPKKTIDAANLVQDAPLHLAARNLALAMHSRPQHTGFGFVKGANGTVYRLVVKSQHAHPEVLQRHVVIAYKAVPQREGGGELNLPTVLGKEPIPTSTRQDIRHALKAGRSLPGDSFARHMSGEYAVLTQPNEKTEITKSGNYLIREPLAEAVSFRARGSIWTPKGVNVGGSVTLHRYSAWGTPGDLAGTVTNQSYAYMYVGGNLEGTMHVGSYATVVIEGDILGTLQVRSYTDLYLGGRVDGKLDCNGSCWSTFYFDGYWSESDLRALGKGFKSVTLHVRESDLTTGKQHQKIGSWRHVIVGDKSWSRFDR